MDAMRFSMERNRLGCRELAGATGREELDWIIYLFQAGTEFFFSFNFLKLPNICSSYCPGNYSPASYFFFIEI